MGNFLEITIKLNKNLNNLRKKEINLIAFALVFDIRSKLFTQNLTLIYIMWLSESVIGSILKK
jgi:hypothetical protein